MNSNTEFQFFAAFSSFLISSQILSNPLTKSSHRIVVSFSIILFGLLITYLYASLFSKYQRAKVRRGLFSNIFTTLISLILCAYLSVYIDSFFDGAAMFSVFYASTTNKLLFCALLIVICAYAGHKSTGGIMRLCSLCFVSFSVYFLALFLSLITMGDIIPPLKGTLNISSQTAFDALNSPLSLFFDIPIFFFAAVCENERHKKVILKKTALKAAGFSIIILLINCMRSVLMYGSTLAGELFSADLSSLQLLPNFSFNEIYLFFTGFSCILKLCVYLYSASHLLPAFGKGTHNIIKTLLPGIFTFIFFALKNSKTSTNLPIPTAVFGGIILIAALLIPKLTLTDNADK